VPWFLRVVEKPGGGWICRHGREEFDDHPDLETALMHIRALARGLDPSEVFVHYADGRVVHGDHL
jgi:hypothetical protein